MNIRTSDQSVSCGKCGKSMGTGFKIQGQTTSICSACLEDYAMQQGTEKTVTIDGIHKGVPEAPEAPETPEA